MKSHLLEQQIAWKRILEERTCPPLDILQKGGKDVEEHLKKCERCREDLSCIDSYNALGDLIPVYEPSAEDEIGHVGEIRSILRQSDDIRDEYGWHNPPMVVLLKKGESEGTFRVAQLHDAPELSEAGDIPLDGDMEGFFAESWNTYSVFIDDMAPAVSSIGEELVSKISSASEDDYCVEEGSLIDSFRREERNIGGFFGAVALVRSINMMEKRSASPIDLSDYSIGDISTLLAWNKFSSPFLSMPMAAANAASTAESQEIAGKPVPVQVKICILKTSGEKGVARASELCCFVQKSDDMPFMLLNVDAKELEGAKLDSFRVLTEDKMEYPVSRSWTDKDSLCIDIELDENAREIPQRLLLLAEEASR